MAVIDKTYDLLTAPISKPEEKSFLFKYNGSEDIILIDDLEENYISNDEGVFPELLKIFKIHCKKGGRTLSDRYISPDCYGEDSRSNYPELWEQAPIDKWEENVLIRRCYLSSDPEVRRQSSILLVGGLIDKITWFSAREFDAGLANRTILEFGDILNFSIETAFKIAGTIGLFRYNEFTSFSVFLKSAIHNRLINYGTENSHTVRIPHDVMRKNKAKPTHLKNLVNPLQILTAPSEEELKTGRIVSIEHLVSKSPDPAIVVESRDLKERLMKALSELAGSHPEYYSIIKKVFVEGKSYTEIGQELNASKTQTKQNIAPKVKSALKILLRSIENR